MNAISIVILHWNGLALDFLLTIQVSRHPLGQVLGPLFDSATINVLVVKQLDVLLLQRVRRVFRMVRNESSKPCRATPLRRASSNKMVGCPLRWS